MRSATRAAVRRASAAALALTVVMLLAYAVPAAAADPVTISARGLLGGRFSVGEWAAISVSLTNDGAPVSGTVAADSTAGEVRRAVELPAGSRKEVVLYVRPDAFTREISVRFTADAGSVTTTAQVQGLDAASTTIGLVGDANGSLRAQLAERDLLTAVTPFDVPATDLPERPEPLAGLSVLVWAADSSGLTEGQRRTLERWVGAGGQLVVIGGADWQARTAAFGTLLPVTDLASVDDVDASALAELGGPLPDGVSSLTMATGTLAAGSRSLVSLGSTDERPLIAMAPHGAGRVLWIAADLAAESFGGWEAGGGIWARLIGNDAARLFDEKSPNGEAAAMTVALQNLPALEVPPAELLLALILGYILLIGPISYVVLRRLDRRELAWVTAPLLVVLFSGCTYGIGLSLKGSEVIVNQISVARAVSGGSASSVTSWAGIFSPSRTRYDLSVGGDALLAQVSTAEGATVGVPTEQGDPAHLRDLAVNVFAMSAVRADSLVAEAPSLSVTWRIVERRLSGTVTNVGDEPMVDVAVLTGSSGELIGDLAGGESREFEVAVADFTGSSPADQVYGFERGNVESGEARARSVRRQVLLGLVGYGEMAAVTPFSAVGDRGPFVVGWREGGTSEVIVDGEDAQRYHQTVEVISGRPDIDPSSIEVQPVDMAVRVVASEGRVDRPDARSVIVVEGSATFELTVPLEVRELVPERINILLATDPRSALVDQNVGGMLPQGITVEVLHVGDDSWHALGDAAVSSRFSVDDPGLALSEDGTITVRISRDTTDVGENPVPVDSFPIYVSGSVSGSL